MEINARTPREKLLIAACFRSRLSTCPRRFWWAWILGAWLMVSTTWPLALAEVNAPSPSVPTVQSPSSLRRGLVTTPANLRALPSIQGEVIAIAKERSSLEILEESGRWYRVRTDDGLEAWIGKTLLQIITPPSEVPTKVLDTVTDSEDSPLREALPSLPTAIDLAPTAAEPQPLPSLTPWERQEALIPFAPTGTSLSDFDNGSIRRFVDTLSQYLERIEGFLLPTLAVVLVLAIILQLRAARQLRRAMREMGMILDIVEELSGAGRLGQTGGAGASPGAGSNGISVKRARSPMAEFSSIERTVLQALSEEREVEESELAKALTQRGFAGILLKAVIAEILRKTNASGIPGIDVRYHDGHYSYKLRSGALTSLPTAFKDTNA
jgi:hypothetical protein